LQLFSEHGIEVVGFWSAHDPDDATTGTLVYVCTYPSRAAADAAWKSFVDNPEWQRAKSESETDGSLTSSVESLYMDPTDFSPIQ
jgi:hypothetical protein